MYLNLVEKGLLLLQLLTIGLKRWVTTSERLVAEHGDGDTVPQPARRS
jgi:hypothetical protein